MALAPELMSGAVSEADVTRASVLRELASRPVPPRPVRAAQRLAMKAGRLGGLEDFLAPCVAARTAVPEVPAAAPPRFLIRVDEFPHYAAYDEPARYGLEAAWRFHGIMAGAGVRYLLAIVPQLTRNPLDPHASGGRPLEEGELELIGQMRDDGVVFAQHGTTHRTRHPRPRHRSELCGLSRAELDTHLDIGLRLLAGAGIEPRVFVPPFNRFDAAQYEALAARFDVVCGGPETVALMGFHTGPLWRGEAVYLPCYRPLYGTARDLLATVERIIAQQVGTWIPIVLHVGWEVDEGLASLPELARRIAPYALGWDEFLSAVGHASP